jgi:hypothetical protein
VLPLTVKPESDTRWSARSEAVRAIYEGLEELVELLESMSVDLSMSAETRSDAEQLLSGVLNFNFVVLLKFWNTILGKIDRIQRRLQDPTMNFREAAADLECLKQELVEARSDLIENAAAIGKARCAAWGIETERRTRRRKRMFEEQAVDAGLTSEDEITRVMKSVIDRLYNEMSTRFLRIKDLDTKFGFLLDVKTLLSGTDTETLRESCINFGLFYDTDVSGEELITEIEDCKMLLRTRIQNIPKTPVDFLEFIVAYGDDVFPNLRISLQILLTVAVSIASCERSFSKLKLISSYLRASMGQERLSDLALLSIEREQFEKINFDDVIDQFATVKSRKIYL